MTASTDLSTPGDTTEATPPESDAALDAARELSHEEDTPVSLQKHPHITFAVVVSVLALILSLGTSGYSIYHEAQRDHEIHRSNLRDLIKFLINLNSDKEADYVNAVSKEAFYLVMDFPEDATTPEMLIISDALYKIYDFRRAEQLIELATKSADNPADEARARREWGSILMFQKHFKEADAQFDQAMRLQVKYADQNQFVYSRNTWTLIAWANAMSAAGRCEEAQQKMRDAENLLPYIPKTFGPWAKQLVDNSKIYYSRYCDTAQ